MLSTYMFSLVPKDLHIRSGADLVPVEKVHLEWNHHILVYQFVDICVAFSLDDAQNAST